MSEEVTKSTDTGLSLAPTSSTWIAFVEPALSLRTLASARRNEVSSSVIVTSANPEEICAPPVGEDSDT